MSLRVTGEISQDWCITEPVLEDNAIWTAWHQPLTLTLECLVEDPFVSPKG
jgi:hypothetical protein